MTKRYVPYKCIANEKIKTNYFQTAYQGQFKERVGFVNNARKMMNKSSGFSDTDRLNEYLVAKGIPEHSNYVSACYPPIPIGNYGSNQEYLKLKKYSPLYLTEKRNVQAGQRINGENTKTIMNLTSPSQDVEDEDWFLKCK